MTDINIDQIEARAKAATPGDWWTDGAVLYRDALVFAGNGKDADFLVADGMTGGDATHIAGMSPAVTLALVARVREAEAERDELRATVARVEALHADGGDSQGYFVDANGHERYSERDHCCVTCGTHGEYGIEWPCPTIKALRGDQ